MAPPAVQDLQTLVNQYKTAYAPESAQINSEIAANDESGGAQVSALDAAKTGAFNTIKQNANDRGAYFSGFTPNEQATYLGTKYMPALASLQDTIAKTRSGLLEKQVGLDTQANTQALSEQNNQKTAASAYATAQEAAQQKAELAAEANATRIQAAQIAASSRMSAASNKTPSPADVKLAVGQHVANEFSTNQGADKHVSNEVWAGAYQDAMAAGFTPREFWQKFGNFTHNDNTYDKHGNVIGTTNHYLGYGNR